MIFLRTRFGTFPPGPGCARSTSATRNHEDLDPCSRLSSSFPSRLSPVGSERGSQRFTTPEIAPAGPLDSPGVLALGSSRRSSPVTPRRPAVSARARLRVARGSSSGSRPLPRRPREEAAVATIQDAFPRLALTFPASRREPHPGRECGRVNVPSYPLAGGAEESVARSPPTQPVRACASELASFPRRASSLRDGAMRRAEAATAKPRSCSTKQRRTGHRRRALTSSPARGRRPCPRGTSSAVSRVRAPGEPPCLTPAAARGSRPSTLVGPSLSGAAATGSRSPVTGGPEHGRTRTATCGATRAGRLASAGERAARWAGDRKRRAWIAVGVSPREKRSPPSRRPEHPGHRRARIGIWKIPMPEAAGSSWRKASCSLHESTEARATAPAAKRNVCTRTEVLGYAP